MAIMAPSTALQNWPLTIKLTPHGVATSKFGVAATWGSVGRVGRDRARARITVPGE